MDKGLLLATDEISRTMRSQLQNLKKEVVTVGPEHFDAPESELDWFESINKAPEATYTVKTPYPHQAEALENIENGWQDHDRGKCIMACGTGKTLVGLWTAEALQSKTTLVLLPSLSLVNQIATEWLREAKIPISPLFVCSDKTVKKGADEYITNREDLGFPVTTDENEIVSFFQNAPAEHRVIFSTYQSSESIEKAQKLGAPKFDVVIADEAHHCAGKIDKHFARVLDAEKIRSDKRLFMTATPKYVTKRLRKESENYDVELASMDDEDLFGPSFHTLNFGEAISRELLSDYQVVVNIITEKDAENMIKNREMVSVSKLQSDPQLESNAQLESDAESVAMMTSLIQVIEEIDLSHIITFHNRIAQAKQLSQGLNVLFPQIHENYENNPPSINHISGNMTTKDRAGLLKRFREADGGINILSNAKCLTEGVDVRAIDGIAFFEPKRSQIEIVQAVGRAIRKNKEDKAGTIFIPIYIPENDINDPELVLQNSRFKDVWDVLQALRDHDQILADELDKLRMELGQKGNMRGGLPRKIVFNMPTRIDADFFRDKIETLLVMETTTSWQAYYGAFIAYNKENPDVLIPARTKYHDLNLGYWVSTQRAGYKKGTLSAERIERLEEAGMIW
jgi:predicted helicase